MAQKEYISPIFLLYFGLVTGLAAIVICAALGSLFGIFIVMAMPAMLYYLLQTIRMPIIAFYGLFILNYFIIAIMRYTHTSGLSAIMDIGLLYICFATVTHSILTQKLPWKNAFNFLTMGALVWALFCFFQLLNPTAISEAWMSSRNIIYSGLVVSFIASVLVTQYKHVKQLLFLLSILVLLACIKAFMQKYIGFDGSEKQWLAEGGARTHIIATGTRYFSFFTDAGNFGSNMGFASVVFGISAIYTSNKNMRIYYIIIALLALCGLFMSGTRGAIAVPLGGLLLFCLISKKFSLMAITAIIGICIYTFFAFAYIGQGNAMIRRMRTTFRPTEDASFNVRLDNQKKLAEYLRERPFGEGLGLGGVEAKRFAERATTLIPHDSTYVKIWMETGIVGLTLYLGLLITALLWACFIIMFKVKHKKLRGILTAMLCGIFGLMISAYGNAFFNQFPTQIIVFTCLTIAINGHRIEKYTIDNQTNK